MRLWYLILQSFSNLEATTHQLTVEKEMLLKQVEELQLQLKLSEDSHLLSEQRCVNLEEKGIQQEGVQTLLKQKVKDVEVQVSDLQ